MPWRGGEGGYGSQYGPTTGENSVDYSYATDSGGTFYPVDPDPSPSGGPTRGDIETQGAEFVWNEDFEDGVDGAVWTVPATAFTLVGGTAFTNAFTAAGAIYGTMAVRVNPALGVVDFGEISGAIVTNTAYLRTVIDLDNGWPVGGQIDLMSIRGAGNTILRARLGLTAAGAIEIRNSNAIVYTTPGPVPASGRVRIEWKVDTVAGQTVRLFYGSNINGTTPDVDSGAQTYNQGSLDTFRFGLITTTTTSPFSFVIDEVMVRTDTWCGAPTSAYVPVTASGVLAATAALTAAVGGPLVAMAGTLAASATMTCSVSGTQTIPATLSASVTTSTSVSGTGTTAGALSASAALTAAATGTLVTHPGTVGATAALTAAIAPGASTIPATVAATAALTAAVTGIKSIPSTLAASATTSTSVSGTATKAGTLSASAALTAAATGFGTHFSTTTATVTMTAAVVTGASSAVAATAALTAAVTGIKSIPSTLAATVALTAAILGNKSIPATVAATLAATAAILGNKAVPGTAGASATLTVAVVGVRGQNGVLAASIVTSVSVAGTVTEATFPYFPGCPVIVTVIEALAGVIVQGSIGRVIVQKVVGSMTVLSNPDSEARVVHPPKVGVVVTTEALADAVVVPC